MKCDYQPVRLMSTLHCSRFWGNSTVFPLDQLHIVLLLDHPRPQFAGQQAQHLLGLHRAGRALVWDGGSGYIVRGVGHSRQEQQEKRADGQSGQYENHCDDRMLHLPLLLIGSDRKRTRIAIQHKRCPIKGCTELLGRPQFELRGPQGGGLALPLGKVPVERLHEPGSGFVRSMPQAHHQRGSASMQKGRGQPDQVILAG